MRKTHWKPHGKCEIWEGRSGAGKAGKAEARQGRSGRGRLKSLKFK